MKTTAKQLTTYGNLALVQIELRPETTFPVKAGDIELRNGGLVITEATVNGIVGTLIAENKSDSFLLLTDADVLIGAKQNRILNKSVLLSPFSKTILDVSCVERRRWHYTTQKFSINPVVADHDIRKDKAKSIAFKVTNPDNEELNTQSEIWSSINSRMAMEGFESVTENYSDMMRFNIDNMKFKFPICESEKSCNGLAILIDKKVVCIDLFGTTEIYNHYFPKLKDSAFLRADSNDKQESIGVHEAYFKVLDMLDNYERTDKNQEKEYTGAGEFSITDNKDFVGFDLSFENQIIHDVLFVK